jgi:hypothetical protein
MVERGMHSDFAEPMLERGTAIKLLERTPGFEKGFLRKIFEAVMIPLVAIEYGKYMRLMAPDKFGKFFLRTVPDSLQQFGIVAHWAFVSESTPQLVGARFCKAS